jgi:DNA (cytosine-5)-methyltransferase 1
MKPDFFLMEKLNGLDLFSGIGGITFALDEWIKPIAYCENNRYCQAVLMSRMADGSLPIAPIWDDIRTLRGEQFSGRRIDIIYGGFPCQDISSSGHRRGLGAERSGLFYEIIRLVDELRPSYIFLENVANISMVGGLSVTAEITACGYDCRWQTIPTPNDSPIAEGKRWFLLAQTNGQRRTWQHDDQALHRNGASNETIFSAVRHIPGHFGQAAPNILRVGHGIPCAVDRIAALGNAVVPSQAQKAFVDLINMRLII